MQPSWRVVGVTTSVPGVACVPVFGVACVPVSAVPAHRGLKCVCWLQASFFPPSLPPHPHPPKKNSGGEIKCENLHSRSAWYEEGGAAFDFAA
eukprot:1130006-Rhodomonas_salina.2